MNFRDYLHKKEITVTQAAIDLDYNRCYLSDMRLGNKMPTKKLMRRMIAWSNGEITEEHQRAYYERKQKLKNGGEDDFKKQCTCGYFD